MLSHLIQKSSDSKLTDYFPYILVLLPQQGEVMVHSLEQSLAEVVVKHKLVDHLDFLLEGHSAPDNTGLISMTILSEGNFQ